MPYGTPKSIEEYLADKYGQGAPELAPYQEAAPPVVPPEAVRAPAAAPEPVAPPPVVPAEKAQDGPDYEFYQNDARSAIAEDLARKNQERAGYGNAIQTLIKATSGFDGSDFYDKMGASASAPVAQEEKRQAGVRDYLKEKYEGGIRDKGYGLQLKALEESLRHNRATEDIDRGKVAATLGADSAKKQSPFGQMATEDDAKKAKDVATSYDAYTKKIDRLMELRKKNGGEAYGPIAAEMESLAASAKIDFKNMAQLGALSESDLDLVQKALGDATTHLSSDESVLASLATARKNADEQIRSFAKGHGVTGDGVVNPQKSGTTMFDDPEKQRRYEEYKKSRGL